MKRFKTLALSVILTLSVLHSHAQDEYSPDFQNLLESVVRIDVWESDYKTGLKETARSQGSGVIVSPEGYILTNAHVVDWNVEKIRITLPNLEFVDAKFIGWDHWTDLALIQIVKKENADKSKTTEFKFAKLGNDEPVYLGMEVYAIGTPYGLTRSLSKGVISNTNRYVSPKEQEDFEYEKGLFNNWLQTDAAINPGNSGGPLVNRDGKIIGINAMGITGANNLSFAIPASTIKGVMDSLLKNGKVERSYIGLKARPMQELEGYYDLNAGTGMLVESVDAGSPAKEAGLKPGDIVLTINGESVDGRFPEQLPPLMNKIASQPVGSEVALNVLRGKENLSFNMKTEALEGKKGKEHAVPDWGITVRELTKPVAREKKLDSNDGLVVVGVQGGFKGSLAGIQPGDILTKVADRKIKSLEDIEAFASKKDKDVVVEANRNRRTVYLVVKAD